MTNPKMQKRDKADILKEYNRIKKTLPSTAPDNETINILIAEIAATKILVRKLIEGLEELYASIENPNGR